MSKGKVNFDLEERLIEFAVRTIQLAESLPKSKAGNHIAGQLIRCGTAPAPNYGDRHRAAIPRLDIRHSTLDILRFSFAISPGDHPCLPFRSLHHQPRRSPSPANPYSTRTGGCWATICFAGVKAYQRNPNPLPYRGCGDRPRETRGCSASGNHSRRECPPSGPPRG